jgi:hypothetical protein
MTGVRAIWERLTPSVLTLRCEQKVVNIASVTLERSTNEFAF